MFIEIRVCNKQSTSCCHWRKSMYFKSEITFSVSAFFGVVNCVTDDWTCTRRNEKFPNIFLGQLKYILIFKNKMADSLEMNVELIDKWIKFVDLHALKNSWKYTENLSLVWPGIVPATRPHPAIECRMFHHWITTTITPNFSSRLSCLLQSLDTI